MSEAFEDLFQGRTLGCIGRVTEDSHLVVRDRAGSRIIHEEIQTLKDAWKEPFGGLV